MLNTYLDYSTQCTDKKSGKVGCFAHFGDSRAVSPVFNNLADFFNWCNRFELKNIPGSYDQKVYPNNMVAYAMIHLGWQGGTRHQVIEELERRIDDCLCYGSGLSDYGHQCQHCADEKYLHTSII